MKEKKKIFKNIINYLFIAILMFCLISVFISRINKKTPYIFGFSFSRIVSPSMEPELKVGDVIISKRFKGQKIQVGDVVTYVGSSGQMRGRNVTHKVLEVNSDSLITYGINKKTNSSHDDPISISQVESVLVKKSVILTFVFKVLTNVYGFVFLVICPLVFFIGSEVFEIIKESKRKEAQLKNEEDISK